MQPFRCRCLHRSCSGRTRPCSDVSCVRHSFCEVGGKVQYGIIIWHIILGLQMPLGRTITWPSKYSASTAHVESRSQPKKINIRKVSSARSLEAKRTLHKIHAGDSDNPLKMPAVHLCLVSRVGLNVHLLKCVNALRLFAIPVSHSKCTRAAFACAV